MKTSRLKGFYKLSVEDRLEKVAQWADLTDQEAQILREHAQFSADNADHMIENVIGLMPLGLGIAPNFRVNGRDYLVPLSVEEPSVVAAASNAARYLRHGDGVQARYLSNRMIGQVQLLDIENLDQAQEIIEKHKDEFISLANSIDSQLIRLGGGLKDVEVRPFPDAPTPFLVVHLIVDCLDAMGANAVNTICERLAPRMEMLTEGRVGLKILSNLCDQRLVECCGQVPLKALDKNRDKAVQIARGVEEASIFAECDPYRAATHNKGFMNGVDSFLIATGQDWRAVEAGAHAYMAQDGRYRSMGTWRLREKLGVLEGRATIPMSVGIVGGITKVHPTVKTNLKILGVTKATELGEIAVSVGLAQNLAAIMALSTEGIQRGHMSLHSRNVAVSVGAVGDEIEAVSQALVKQGKVQWQKAQEILWEVRRKRNESLRKCGEQNYSQR